MPKFTDEDIDHLAFILNSKADKFLPKLHEAHSAIEQLLQFKQDTGE